SCGLPTPSYLAPPLSGGAGLNNTFTFTNDGVNNNTGDFYGYELYYKFYSAVGTSSLSTDQAAIQTSTTPGTALLTSEGYIPILPNIDPGAVRSLPLIPFDATQRALPITVKLDFQGFTGSVVQATATLSDGTPSIELKRNAPPGYAQPTITLSGGTTVLKGFLSNNYASTDSDLSSVSLTTPTNSSASVTLAVVVLAYGVDLSTLSAIYSTPFFLGTVNLNYGAWATQS
ncbi:MAG TPA: hypothetical protein VMW73_12275, partial [Spirochaetia bacterium]|nr:hypothetical protein [Spirochaetia bacterium]